MDYRPLGRTGVKVSPLCLGAMMFGAWGNTDHDESIRIIHRALDAGINFIDTADVYSRGESEEIVGKALAEGRRDDVVLATKVHGTMGDDPNQRGNSRRWIVARGRGSLRRLQTDWIDLYQIHRPEPDTDIDETLGALTDLVHAGQGPLRRLLDVPRLARSSRRSGWRERARPRALRVRAAALLDPRARHRERRAARPAGATAWASSRGRRSPAAGCRGRWRKGQDAPSAHAPSGSPARYDLSQPRRTSASSTPSRRSPSSPRRPGMTLIQLALAFVINHPAVTSAIIGPRTMEQLESPARRRRGRLDAELLDRIDEIVPPGTTLTRPTPAGQNPALKPEARRR